MKVITAEEISEIVASLVIEANTRLPHSVTQKLAEAQKTESSPLARSVLCDLCENARIAGEEKLPLCQDTGMYTVFCTIGSEIALQLETTLEDAISEGVKMGCTRGYMRLCTLDPLTRENLQTGAPAVVYTTFVRGDKFCIDLLPKGFGSENMARTAMLLPEAGEDAIISFITETVKNAGGKPCPPLVLGIGIGGTFDYAAVLAKRALLRPLGERHPDSRVAALEERVLRCVNDLGIGPQGFGGDITALSAAIEVFPTHIAGLPVSVNPCCHVCRHAHAEL